MLAFFSFPHRFASNVPVTLYINPDIDVRTLQRKVMFDIRYYFARRGTENMKDMRKDTFQLFRDETTGLNYIKKVRDEETKNHTDCDDDITTAFMPGIPNNKMCPVQSYLTYFYSLSKDSDDLWQTPRYAKFPEDPRIHTWYSPKPVGHNTHDSFVTNVAKKMWSRGREVPLSPSYSNNKLEKEKIFKQASDVRIRTQIQSKS